MKNIIKENKVVVEINDDNINDVIKNIKKTIKTCDKDNLNLSIIYKGKEINNIKSTYSKELKDLINIKTAISIKNKKDRYSFIYDTICNELDDRINKENYCEFENDVCIRFRTEDSKHKNGCCEWKGRGKCKYLKSGVCTMKTCMACKLFTCKFLQKTKGIKQSINDFTLAKCFFNRNQRYILECSFWTPKDIVIKRLLDNNIKIN